ncbi:MAG: hypothetical protein ABL904_20635 [Hyphomicrobiaceae bacterium]
MANGQALIDGIEHAIAGRWDEAHKVAQSDEDDRDFCWLHACLHKIEGDESNARYWYRRSGHSYEEYADPKAELASLKAALTY